MFKRVKSHIQRNDPRVLDDAQRLCRRGGQIRRNNERRFGCGPERKVCLLLYGCKPGVPDLEHVEIVESTWATYMDRISLLKRQLQKTVPGKLSDRDNLVDDPEEIVPTWGRANVVSEVLR